MPALNIEELHDSLKQNINRPAELMRDNFSSIMTLLPYVTPYLIISGKMPLPRLKTERILTHNNGSQKDEFLRKENLMKLTERWLEPQYGKINVALKESEILALWNSYLFQLNAVSGDTARRDYMVKFPFEDVLYEEIVRRSFKDMLDDSYKGVIANGSDSPVTGLLTKIADAMTPASVGAPTEIASSHVATTADFTESNVVAELKKVFSKVAATPGALGLQLDIHIAPEVVWLYNNYKETLNKTFVPVVQNGHQVPNELLNARFVPTDGLAGTNAVIITPKNNIAFGLNTTPGNITMRTALVDYEIRIYGQTHFDVNFNDGRYIWVNDNLA